MNNVKRTLMEIPEVTEADVQLAPQGALVTMNKSIDTEVLQARLNKAGHYTISYDHTIEEEQEDHIPDIERSHSFSDAHPERHNRPFGIDHEPGVI